jgi:hypothetical protein
MILFRQSILFVLLIFLTCKNTEAQEMRTVFSDLRGDDQLHVEEIDESFQTNQGPFESPVGLYPEKNDSNELFVAVDGRFTDDHFKLLTDIAVPEIAVVDLRSFIASPELTISKALQERCRRFPSENIKGYQYEAIKSLNTNLINSAKNLRDLEDGRSGFRSLTTQEIFDSIGDAVLLPGELELEMPPCFPDNSPTKRIAKKYDTFEEIAQERAQILGREFRYSDKLELLKFNESLLKWRNSQQELKNQCELSDVKGLECASRFIRPGDTIIISNAKAGKTIKLASLDMIGSRSRIIASLPQGAADSSFDNILRMQELTSVDCKASNGFQGIDFNEVWERYQIELSKFSNKNTPKSAKIGIIDSGLRNKSTYLKNWPFYGESMGVSGSKMTDIEPLEDSEFASHGSLVTSLALGGYDFLSKVLGKKNMNSSYVPPIKFNMYVLNSKSHSAWTIMAGLEHLTKEADIINVSAAAKRRTGYLANVIQSFGNEYYSSGGKPLLVIAAGNGVPPETLGLDLAAIPSDVQLVPAILGGTENEHIITVAALDGKNELAFFSNYHSDIVDIAAPGCNVPAIDDLGVLRNVSGTSMSAPLVTFTAGLISSLDTMPRNPSFQKARITMSADYTLLPKNQNSGVRNNAILNIVRAISVRTDVLTYDNKMVFGQVQEWELESADEIESGVKYSIHKGDGMCEPNTRWHYKDKAKRVIVKTAKDRKKTFSVYYPEKITADAPEIVRVKECSMPFIDRLKFLPEGKDAQMISLGELDNFDLMLASYQ